MDVCNAPSVKVTRLLQTFIFAMDRLYYRLEMYCDPHMHRSYQLFDR